MYPTIESSAKEMLFAALSTQRGTVVPDTDDVALKNGGKLVDATFLYADLAKSTELAHSLTKEAAAAIIKTYLNTASRILRHWDGEIRSFDGDRVMAIFIGDRMATRAVRAALGVNWALYEVLRPLIAQRWPDGKSFSDIGHGIGIDTGEALIVRGGVRGHNDLVSVGHAPNVAAKLSSKRDSYSIYITEAVREKLEPGVTHFSDGSSIWSELGAFSNSIGGTYYRVHGSNAWWEC